jgi:competence protein ComEC
MGLHRMPMLKGLFPFVGGILMAERIPFPGEEVIWAGKIGALLLLFVAHYLEKNYRRKGWFLGALCLAFLGLGVFTVKWHSPDRYSDHIQHRESSAVAWVGKVLEQKPSGKKVRLRLSLLSARDSSGHWDRARGKIEAYLQPDSQALHLSPGDRMVFHGQLVEVAGPRNPEAFDYRAYLARKGVFHQLFLDAAQWKKLDSRTFDHLRMLHRLRAYVFRQLRETLSADGDFGLATTLLVGTKRYLPEEERKAYARAGVAHVLAVSGLHVGILAFGLGYLFYWVPLPARIKAPLVLTCSLLLLVLYCLMTGLAPSVQRATLMYGMVLLGAYFPARGNLFNSLAFAAWVMLICNPNLLADVGFQLSFLAVLGIVFFQPPLERLPGGLSGGWKAIWSLITVSLAAQLGTFPLTLYYFHSFPTYFWISGVFIVPLVKVILYLGILFLTGSELPFWGQVVGKPMEWAIRLTNWIVEQFSTLPGGVIENIGADVLDLFFWYGTIVGLVLLVKNRFRLGLWCSLIFLALFSGKNLEESWRKKAQNQMVVYAASRDYLLLDFFAGTKRYTLRDPSLSDKSESFAADGFRVRKESSAILSASPDTCLVSPDSMLSIRDGWVVFGDYRMAILDRAPEAIPTRPVPVDLLILRGRSYKDFEKLKAQVSPKTVLLLAPNTYWQKKWQSSLASTGWEDVRTLREEGAFIENLKNETS